MGGGQQCSGPGPTKPDAFRVGGADRGAGGGPGSSLSGGARREQEQQQAPAPGTASLLEGLLLPGQSHLIQSLYKKKPKPLNKNLCYREVSLLSFRH